jgi:hypothetical protein
LLTHGRINPYNQPAVAREQFMRLVKKFETTGTYAMLIVRTRLMTAAAELPQASTPPVIKRWHVEMADRTARTIEARGFRVESGALVLVQPAGCAAAYGPSTWLTIEEIHTEG